MNVSFFPSFDVKSAHEGGIGNPCIGCPRERARKVLPTHCARPLLAAVGMGPGGQEELQGRPFVGPSGQMLRAGLRSVDIDPETQVAYLNLGRCRPAGDDFDSAEWKTAERHCARYLAQDLTRYRGVPLLLLGTRPLQRMLGNSKVRLGAYRGLWIKTVDGQDAFVARHPGQILRTENPVARAQLTEQFAGDLRRMAERIHGRETPAEVHLAVVTTLGGLQAVAARLAGHRGLWAFDLEAYDAGAFPSRKGVATDPCHPDFRVRGVAIAWSATRGVWLELAPLALRRVEVCAALTSAFMSEASKTAFNGHYDEEGLIVPGWIAGLAHRDQDAMLALVALGNGQHESLRLEKAVVDILGKPQYWAVDKARMRDLPLDEVARGAVGDACRTWELTEVLGKRLQAGQYL